MGSVPTNGQSKKEEAELPNDDPRLIEAMRGVDAYLSRGNVRLRLGLIATEEDVERDREAVRRIKFL